MATIGQILAVPETGWQRIDDTNSLIKYSAVASSSNSSADAFNSSYKIVTMNAFVSFAFNGTKFRLISRIIPSLSNTFDVYIDNNLVDSINYLGSTYQSSTAYQVVTYGKTGLEQGTHIVKIINKSSNNGLFVDAFDIDQSGSILPMPAQIGDSIKIPETGWQRFDNNAANIKYTGSWTQDTPSAQSCINYYKDTRTYTPGISAAMIFNFTGPKLRILGSTYSAWGELKITLDGTSYIATENISPNDSYGSELIFEKTSLADGTHTVIITKNTDDSKYIVIDAIDIDAAGSLLAPPRSIWDKLLQPDDGWSRYDDSASQIKRLGSGWNGINGSAFYNGSVIATTSPGTEIDFNIKSTRLRLISSAAPVSETTGASFDVYIDGIKKTTGTQQAATTHVDQALLAEIVGLSNNEHSVRIVNTSSSTAYFYVDAIDIDSAGSLLPYNPNPGLHLAKTIDGHYWSHKSGAWIDLGIPADQAALLALFKLQGEDACPTQALISQLGGGVERCRWASNATASLPNAVAAAIPFDQFIHANGDVDLSGYGNVDWIRTNDGTSSFESGSGKIRHLASRDQGKTWWTYDGSQFVQVLDTVADGTFSGSRFIPSTVAMARIMSQGMSKAVFDAAPWQSWTLDVGFSKIRFGYGLSIAATSDAALADNLKIQYDGFGDWILCQNKVDYNLRATPNQYEVEMLAPLNGARVKVNYG